ncbi:MAG TPA: aromatic ring-hydroxylating dioxygenase subunit alpha [Planctomycetota bacterium]|nr:aromatic ring-hydroxylating dioxygenase subunit alpha [Planctomycetota bacterium]
MNLTEADPFRVLRRTWQPVVLSRDLREGGVRSVRLLDQEVVVARFPGGRLLASQSWCPHKGMRLEKGRIDGRELVCAYHGWRFDAAGACTAIPSLVEPLAQKQEQARLGTYAVRERYGMVWVRLEAPELAPLPDVPEYEDPRWTYVVADPMPFKAGFRREIENYLDMTHFAFAHATTLGVAATPVVPPMEIQEFDDGFEMRAPFPALASSHVQPGKLQQAHKRRQRCYLPNFTTIRQSFEDGDERVLLHVPSPTGAAECTVFWSLAISPGFRGPAPEDQMRFAVNVLEEDRTMCENQVPPEVPINPARGGWGVLVTPGDTLANTFQRTFRRFLQAALRA